jgi:AcrR family transcriptional regulator
VRRGQILETAVKLFYERGYHATGIDDIGAAVGITGPGIYRHFKSKEAILNAALEQGMNQIVARVQQIVEEGRSAPETLDRLIRTFIRAVLNNPPLAELVMNERRIFTPETRAWFDRADRMHMEEWVHAASQIRTELNDGEIRLLVNAAWGMLASVVTYSSGLDRTRLEDVLHDMAWAGLVGSDRPKRARRHADLRPLN